MKKDTRGIIAAGLLGIAAAAALVFGIWNLLPLFGEPEGGTPMTLYQGPKTMGNSIHAVISAGGESLFVYDTVVNHSRENRGDYDVSTLALTPMTYFDADFTAGGVPPSGSPNSGSRFQIPNTSAAAAAIPSNPAAIMPRVSFFKAHTPLILVNLDN
ncbi:hypothetical protein FACS1894202_08670 [Clostridia bacterium]|nr:hypothetical protein FACS1894202_08670 [Clostridia bacterium]